MLTFFQLNLRGQSEILLSQNFGGSQDETFQDLFINADGEANIIGYSRSNEGLIQGNKGLYDILVCEMSNNGNVNWSTNIGGSKNDLGSSVLIHDENIFIGGLTYSKDQDIPNSKGGGDILFGSLDTEQKFDAVSVLGGNKLDNIVGLQMMLDGSIIVVANTNSTDVNQTGVGGATDIYVCRMLSNGVILWETKFGSNKVDKATDVVINGQDEILIVGTTFSENFLEFRKGIKDGFVLCINNTGDQIWGKRFGNGNYTSFTACDIDANNNILISGTQGQINNSNSGINGIYNEDVIVFKLNDQGEEIWQRKHGGTENDYATDIISTLDGGILIAGNTLSFDFTNINFGGHDGFALKLNQEGQKEWSKTYGGSADDAIHSVTQNKLGQYWLVGQTASSDVHLSGNKGGNDAWVLKLKGKAPQFTIELGAPISVCEGEQVNIDASISNCDCSYTWSDGVDGAFREFTAVESRTLNLTVNDGAGNVASDDIRVIVNAKPVFGLEATNISCANGSDGEITATVFSEATSLSYAWNGNTTTGNVLSGLSTGTYELTVTNENNCSSNQSIDITEPEILEASAEISNAVCENLEGEILLEVTGGSGSYEYNWSSGQSTNSLVSVGAGTYTVTITDSNACTLVKNYTIEQDENEFNLDFDIINNSCSGFEEASISILNGNDIRTYAWSNGESTASIENLIAGDYTLDYITKDGCVGMQTFTITEAEPIIAEATVVNNACGDAREGSISLDISGGTGSYILAWVNGESTTSIEGLTAGNYSVTINDENECALILEEVISAPQTIILEDAIITDAQCFGEDKGAIEIIVSGGTGNLEYIWSTGSSASSISNLDAGVYQVTVADDVNCTNIFEFTIDGAKEFPEFNIEQNEPLCFGSADGTISLSEEDGIAFIWQDGFVGHERDDLTAGDYIITAGNDFGCTKEITVSLSAPVELDMSFNLEHVSCFGSSDGSISVNPNGGTTPYTLTIENTASEIFGLSGDQNLENLPAGLYFVRLEDANGCILGLPIVLQEPADSISIEASVIDVSCFGEMDGQISINANGGTGEYSYNWEGKPDTSVVSSLSGGTYQIEVTDENNCVVTDTIEVNEPNSIEVESELTTPSASNDDGMISLTLSGGIAPYTIIWTNGEEGAILDNLGNGTYEYTIIDSNDCSLTGSILLEGTTSAFDKEQITEISIFPNPTSRDLFIKTDVDYRDLQLNLHNALGQLVQQSHYDTFARGTHQLSVTQLPSGIYYLSLSNTESQGIYKVVVEHP